MVRTRRRRVEILNVVRRYDFWCLKLKFCNLCYVAQNLYDFFLMQNIKEDILKNVFVPYNKGQ